MSHTKEPWSMLDTGRDIHINKSGGVGFIGSIHIYEHRAEQCRENARRIVACVNACAGIPTDDLEQCPSGGLFHLADMANEVVKQRDNLLAFVERVSKQKVEPYFAKEAIAALASAKGGAA